MSNLFELVVYSVIRAFISSETLGIFSAYSPIIQAAAALDDSSVARSIIEMTASSEF